MNPFLLLRTQLLLFGGIKTTSNHNIFLQLLLLFNNFNWNAHRLSFAISGKSDLIRTRKKKRKRISLTEFRHHLINGGTTRKRTVFFDCYKWIEEKKWRKFESWKSLILATLQNISHWYISCTAPDLVSSTTARLSSILVVIPTDNFQHNQNTESMTTFCLN